MDPIELMLVNVKSTPLVVDSEAQLRFSLPVSVNVRLVEFVGPTVVAARVTVGAVLSTENVLVVENSVSSLSLARARTVVCPCEGAAKA